MVDDERMPLREGEQPEMRMVRFRTLGCYPLSAPSSPPPPRCPRSSRRCCWPHLERQGRVIDHDQAGSMEKKKQRVLLVRPGSLPEAA